MDTNQVNLLIHELIARQSTTMRWDVLIPSIALVLTSVAAYLKSRSAEEQSRKVAITAETIKATGVETKAEIAKISTAVNGGYGAMNAEIAQLKEKNIFLEKEKATLQEYQRAQEEAKLKDQTKKEVIADVTAIKVIELQTEMAKSKEAAGTTTHLPPGSAGGNV